MGGILLAQGEVLKVLAQKAVNGTTAKEKKRDLRTFSGNVGTWCAYAIHLETVREFNRWNDEETLKHLKTALDGEAVKYYRVIDPQNSISLQELLKQFQSRFGAVESAEVLRRQLEQRQQKSDETLEELAADIQP